MAWWIPSGACGYRRLRSSRVAFLRLPGGQVVFTDAAGKQAGEIPLAFAADSKFNPGVGVGGVVVVRV